MRKILFVFTFCLATITESFNGGKYYLIIDGTPVGCIIIPKNSSATICLAAKEIQTYLEKMSDARLPILAQEIIHIPDKPSIVLQTKPEKKLTFLNKYDFHLHSQGKVLYITGNIDQGTLMGAYQFLDNLGVRWYMPGEIGEFVPRIRSLAIPKIDKYYHRQFALGEWVTADM